MMSFWSGLGLTVIERPVPLHLHRVMDYAAHADQAGLDDAIDKKMAWAFDGPIVDARTVATVAQVVRADCRPQLGPIDAADAQWICGDVVQSYQNQCLVALPAARPNRRSDHSRISTTSARA